MHSFDCYNVLTISHSSIFVQWILDFKKLKASSDRELKNMHMLVKTFWQI
jgi:hypothetical protein